MLHRMKFRFAFGSNDMGLSVYQLQCVPVKIYFIAVITYWLFYKCDWKSFTSFFVFPKSEQIFSWKCYPKNNLIITTDDYGQLCIMTNKLYFPFILQNLLFQWMVNILSQTHYIQTSVSRLIKLDFLKNYISDCWMRNVNPHDCQMQNMNPHLGLLEHSTNNT